MAHFVKLDPGKLTPLRQIDERLVSYNIEMTEVTGGTFWKAYTDADVPRTLNELGDFCTVTDGVIFHNTMASSDYGYLKHGTFEPRPNYFAVLLWNRLMGKTCYAVPEEKEEGKHIYCHSRKDGKEGCVYLVINNSWTETTTLELPGEAEVYALTGTTGMRSRTMSLNGAELLLAKTTSCLT